MLKKYIQIFKSVFIFVLTVSYYFSQNVYVSNALTPPNGSFVVSSKKTTLVPGVVETEFVYNNVEGTAPVSGFIVDIKLGSNVNIMAASADYNQVGLQTVRKMAEVTAKKTGKNLVAAINADLNWDGTGVSNGPLIIDGKICSDKPDIFFGITKSGEAIIGDSKKFTEIKTQLNQAVRGMGWLVKDGKVMSSSTDLAPRTAVGIRKDGSVIFYAVEGRMFPRSIGISTRDLAEIMLSNGAVMALNMDGGGSTTYLAKREGESSLALRNIPSDDGIERASISSLMVYAETGDGVFHHASITTKGDVYTPNSVVQFEARGVDSSGSSAELPINLTWKLIDSKYGVIDNTGKFTSSGIEGDVIVQLLESDGKKVGEGKIEIRIPDDITFKSDEFSLGFDETTDFGIRMLYQQRPVTYKNGDIIWEFNPALGSIKNNLFIASSNETVNGLIKATIINTDISKEISLVVGKLPITIFDFENNQINEKWEASSVNGVQSNISVVHKDDGEPVRFGTKSLRLDYDFSTQIRNPGGAYAGFTDQEGLEQLGVTFQLPGSPSGVGMWIYATEEAQGLWLRTGIGINGDTKWKAFDLTKELIGIDWIGWKYVEVSLTDFSGPYTILPGQFIRLMITANSFGGKSLRPTGNIYIDNIMVSYGTNPDDTIAPVINSIKINEIELENSDQLNTNKVTIETSFYDIENKYSSGINFDQVNIYVDGVNYLNSEGYALNITDGKAYLQNVYLIDGIHEVKIAVVDNAGNETVEKRYFSINSEKKNKIYLESSKNVTLGQDFTIELKADEINNINEIDFSLQISNTLSDFAVFFSDAFEGEVEYLNGVRMLNIKSKRISNANVDYILKIVSHINSKLNDNNAVSYNVNRGVFQYVEDLTDGLFLKSFAAMPLSKNVSAPISISSDTILIGDDAIFTVTDVDGQKIENAEIFLINSSGTMTMLGNTDVNGTLKITQFSNVVASYTLVAKYQNSVSFEYKFQTYDSLGHDNGTPYNVSFNIAKNPESSKNISWFSNALSKNNNAYIRYALKSDYDLLGENTLIEAPGTVSLIEFKGSLNIFENYAVNVNNVTINNLISGQHYVYRVGNGEYWSELKEFKTSHIYGDVNLLILGDVQTTNFDEFERNIINIGLSPLDYDYVVQVGDIVDEAGIVEHWNRILSSVSGSELENKDTLHVLGNHEFYGDANGDIAKTIFNLPGNENYYSVENGIVYTAVINYTMNKKDLVEALEWLVEDAKQSNAKWRLLVTHQPPYYTNPQGGNDIFNELVPKYAENAGIDFVFSGHDHAYARTKPIKEGEVAEDGVVYFVTGAIGEKRYTAYNNPNFHFEIMDDTFDSIYISVEASETSINVNVVENETGEIIDTYTKNIDIEENKKFYLVGDRLICYECHYSRPVANYSGFVRTKDEEIMYLINGRIYTGLLILGKDKYYFNDESGIAYIGNTEVMGLSVLFDNEGKYISGGTGFVKEGSYTKYYDQLIAFRGGWLEIKNDTYYFSTSSGYMRTGLTKIGEAQYEFSKDGKLIRMIEPGFVMTTEGVYFVDSKGNKLTGWQQINGETYYFSTSTGYMRTGITNIGEDQYEFSQDGKLIRKLVAGFVVTSEGTYYVDAKGIRLIGWQLINGETYYFSTSTGYMRTGITNIGGDQYEFSQDGKLMRKLEAGFIVTPEGTYYIDARGNKLTGWQQINEYTYYFSSSTGFMRTGRTNVGGVLYDFDNNGKLIGTTLMGFIKTVDGTYYVDSRGYQLYGWQQIDGDTYYFSSSTGFMRTGKKVNVGGKFYDFSEEGKLIAETS